MSRKKLHSPVTLFAAIEQGQYESLRALAFRRRQSMADVVRVALAEYLAKAQTQQSDKPAARRVAATAAR